MVNLKLFFAKTFCNSYYDKLITNIAKCEYFDGHLMYDGYSEEFSDFTKDIDNKLVDIAYNELIQYKYENIKNIVNEYDINYRIILKLLENKDYKVLNDILFNTELFIEKNNYKNLFFHLDKHLFPQVYAFNKINDNLKNLNILKEILSYGNEDKIKSLYIKNLFNSMYNVHFTSTDEFARKSFHHLNNIDNKNYSNNIFILLTNKILDNNDLISKQDILDNMDIVFEAYKENKSFNKEMMILSILECYGLDKNEQYDLLSKKLDNNDEIFQTLLQEIKNINELNLEIN